MSPSDWQPSAAYLEYCERTRNEQPAPLPFSPCSRFTRIEDGCAICAEAFRAVPCPEFKEVFVGIADPGGAPSVAPALASDNGGT